MERRPTGSPKAWWDDECDKEEDINHRTLFPSRLMIGLNF